MANPYSAFPFFFAVLRGAASFGGENLGEMIVELRLKWLESSSAVESFKVLAVRVVRSLDWNPDNPIVFEATSGQVSILKSEGLRGALVGKLAGGYRSPVTTFTDWTRHSDVLVPPLFDSSLELSLNISIGDSLRPVPLLTGRVSVESGSLGKDFGGASRLDIVVGEGDGRLYPHPLPARDAANEVDGLLYLNLVPILVGEIGNEVFVSWATQLGGVKKTWEAQCGITIGLGSQPAPFVVPPTVTVNLGKGNTSDLFSRIGQSVSRGLGVPVALVQVKFSKGGGESSNLGPMSAILMVSDFVGNNDTVLAHEVGHALGGRDAGLVAAYPFWAGKPGTLMDPTGDIAKPDPGTVGDFGCTQARSFAPYKTVP